MKKRVLSAIMILALCFCVFPASASADVLTEDLPEVDAGSYAVIDGDTQQVLFGNDYDKTVDPGSLVQVMTAVLIIEEGNLNDSVTVPEIPEAANKGNRLYLRKGEKVNLSDLLEGIIIYNANDAAIAAANHLAGSEKAFVEEMNARAKELGMADTTFTSVYGSGKNQKTTAHDMAILAAHASSLPKYVELAIQPTLDWESEMNQDTVTNVNGMQNVEQQAVGIKLNQEDPVNLAASMSKGHRTIVGVMLDCDAEDSAYVQMQDILNLGLENTSVVDLITKDEVVATLNFGENKSVRVAATDNYAITTTQGDSSKYRSMVVVDQTELPINEGDEIGTVRIYEGDEVIDEVPVKALDSVSAGINWSFVILVIALILCVLLVIYMMLKRMPHKNSGGPRPPQKPNAGKPVQGKNAPAARVSHPPQNKPMPQGQRPVQKAPGAKRPPQGNGLNKGNLKNPSVGSNAGRQGLEQRLKEKNNGGRR
ncbi:MAG: D-alanyl-D-alanine carboxypeptidase family protein [Peptococcaceae bacterium]|nr:D-alanyl-D-alanine carboxypeptidase family protein [Peptococcaceae bacterium]